MLAHRLAPDAPTVPSGSIVAGRYQLERVLGIGGMGVVYRAKHLVLGERVALKFMQTRYAGVPEATARFVREARSQFRISSDNVVRVLDVGEADAGVPYIAMEYVEGASLKDLMDRGLLEVGTACEVVRQVCEGLASAHRLGIVHRDVKPSNILVTSAPTGALRAKILDFGIAHMVEPEAPDATRLTATSMVLGTLSYIAPEQLRATRSADERSDVWSVGAVLYQLLTGRLPYAAESPADLILRQREGPPTPANALSPWVPAALAALVERCFAFEVNARLLTAARFAQELAAFARPVALSTVLRSKPGVGVEAPVEPAPDGITFRRRKVMNSSGGTAFVMHEPVRPNATAVLPSSAATTARRQYAQAPPRASWERVVVTLAALLAFIALTFGVMFVGVWSLSPEVSAVRLEPPPRFVPTASAAPETRPPEVRPVEAQPVEAASALPRAPVLLGRVPDATAASASGALVIPPPRRVNRPIAAPPASASSARSSRTEVNPFDLRR